jgi:hypothetical protein
MHRDARRITEMRDFVVHIVALAFTLVDYEKNNIGDIFMARIALMGLIMFFMLVVICFEIALLGVIGLFT